VQEVVFNADDHGIEIDDGIVGETNGDPDLRVRAEMCFEVEGRFLGHCHCLVAGARSERFVNDAGEFVGRRVDQFAVDILAAEFENQMGRINGSRA